MDTQLIYKNDFEFENVPLRFQRSENPPAGRLPTVFLLVTWQLLMAARKQSPPSPITQQIVVFEIKHMRHDV